jgi:pseudouridine-5'-phosphate glycosidase
LIDSGIRLGREVETALANGDPVVALESTLVAHGLPRPQNVTIAREIEAIVREEGAVPATIAVLDGTPVVGLEALDLERIASDEHLAKLGVRDLPVVVGLGLSGATTVASTAYLAARAGIRVFATGGLGGVHREARDTWDESADLPALASTPIAVVCAGVKSILDVSATLERLETLGVSVFGYRTHRFPGFYISDSGFSLDWRVESPEEIARILRARDGLGLTSGIVVANALPADRQLDPALHDRILEEGLAALEKHGARGKAVTPFLLAHFHEASGGESLRVNVELVKNNARLAARIARAHCRG